MRILWSLFSVLYLLGATHLRGAEAPAKKEAPQQHSLWKIQGKTNAVYLLGSIHVLSKSSYPLPQPIESAYSNSSTLVFEADIAEMKDPNNAMKLLSKATLPEGKTLESEVSAETYKVFTNHVTEAGFPLFVLERFKPGMAAMTLEVLESQKLGLDPEHGVDNYFFQKAKEDSKEMIPLETLEFQTSLITDLTKEEGELMLKVTLKEIDTVKTQLTDIVSAWSNGDSSKLDKLLNEVKDDAPGLTKKLITDRNERWTPKIDQWLKEDKAVMVIVGAAHLVGKQGVVELLRKKGWKVKQL